MEEILNKLELDETVKKDLLESFNLALTVEANKLLESKSNEYEKQMMSELDSRQAEIIETLDVYLGKAVEEYVNENRIAIDQEVDQAKLNSLLEAFNATTIASGVELLQIQEANEEINESREETYKDMADRLMEENIELNGKVNLLLKTGLVNEASQGMTLLEKETFLKISENITLDGDMEDYSTKIFETADIVRSKKDVTIKESKKVIDSSTGNDIYVSPASHLI